MGEALTPGQVLLNPQEKEVPQAAGGAVKERQRPLSTLGEDRSCVVGVSTAFTRGDGEGGAAEGKNLFQLRRGLGNIPRSAKRGSLCNQDCSHQVSKVRMSAIKALRKKWPRGVCSHCCGNKPSVAPTVFTQWTWHPVTQQPLSEDAEPQNSLDTLSLTLAESYSRFPSPHTRAQYRLPLNSSPHALLRALSRVRALMEGEAFGQHLKAERTQF